MNRLLLTFFVTLAGLSSAFAQDSGIDGDGYYRVRNKGSQRYIYIRDNTGDYSLDVVDYGALQLWKNIDRAVSDPSSVIYVKQVAAGKYDLQAQGTGAYRLVQHYVDIAEKSDGSYEVSASQSGVTKYLSDISNSDVRERGTMGDGGKLNYRKWIADKVRSTNAENYFGVKPTVTIGGKRYRPFYADFPFTTVSDGMKVYYINTVDTHFGVAVLKEIKGVVPRATPVLVECASANPSDNRIEISDVEGTAVTGNLLKGVYFANDERPKSKDAYVKFDASSMRVLDAVDGKLTFTTSGGSITELEVYVNYNDVIYDCIAANHCYLPVSASVQGDLRVITESEYKGLGIDGVAQDKEETADGVFSLQGVRMRADNDTQGLPNGVYIIGGHKVAVK